MLELAQVVLAVTAALLALRAAWPAPAHAADLFPVDDWLGDGIKKAGDVVLGPLKLGAKEIAQLLATIVGALADLLVPKSLVRAGLDGIRWLVQLPPVGVDATPQPGVPAVRMPHLAGAARHDDLDRHHGAAARPGAVERARVSGAER